MALDHTKKDLTNMKKNMKITTLLFTCTMLIIASPINIISVQTSDTNISTETVQSSRSATISWRYKTVKGVLYKRLYDYSSNSWIGDWVIV